MNEDAAPPPRRINPATILKDYWHIGIGVGLLILALGETRWQVRELIRDREVDARQTLNIRNNIVNIAQHEIEIEGMQLHMGPRAIQEYGALKSTVAFDHQRLENHLDRHNESR
jgi:hypothetical protein